VGRAALGIGVARVARFFAAHDRRQDRGALACQRFDAFRLGPRGFGFFCGLFLVFGPAVALIAATTSAATNPIAASVDWNPHRGGSRRRRIAATSGALSSSCACSCHNQFPTGMPVDFSLLTRLVACANSDASRPLSAASAANLRFADIVVMMDDDPRPRSSSDTRHELTVALVNLGRGA